MRTHLAWTSAALAAALAAQCFAGGAAPSGPSRADLARLHAPFYRFNAWTPGSGSPANKSEDYFPMSVGGWLHQLATRRVRVVTRESQGAQRGVNQTKPLKHPAQVQADRVNGVPDRVAGDVPGKGPVYFHVYEEKKQRNPDGSGEDDLVIEYWLFYGQDASRERITRWHISPTLDIAGHEGDWEQMSVAVKVLLGPQGAFLRSEPTRAYYTAHGKPTSVELSDFERTDDTGAVAPRGTHPIVYVAVGKHASYPEPGTWTDPAGYAPLIIHDEFFRGNGFQWLSWRTSRLIDLDGPSSQFASKTWTSLLAPGLQASDWRSYGGTFGDDRDLHIPLLGTFPVGESPRAPQVQSSYRDLASKAKPWADEKRTAKGLHLGASPLVVPCPLPQRLP